MRRDVMTKRSWYQTFQIRTQRSIGVQKPPQEVGDALLDAGATLFTIGFGGPHHDLGLLKEWIAWRDDRRA